MISALRYELARIRTIRSTWWITGLTVVVGVGIAILFAWAIGHDFSQHPPSADDRAGLGAAVVTQLGASGQIPLVIAYLVAIIGIFAWGHEYRHGMIRASLTALNSRSALWFAKYLVAGAWAAVVTFVTMVISGVVAIPFLKDYVTVFDAQTWGVLLRGVLFAVLLTWLAMAFTSVTRSQTFALVTLFLWPLLIESLLHVFFLLIPGLRHHDDILRFLPFGASRRMIDVLTKADSTFGAPLSPLGGSLVFGLVTAVLLAASYVLFSKRDA